MRRRHRTTARLCAAAVALAVGGLWAAPASAAPVADIRVALTGGTLSVGVPYSAASLSLFNAGPGDAVDVTVTVDFGGLDTTRVLFDTAMCVGRITTFCEFGLGALPAGAEADYFLPLGNAGGGAGPAGSLAAFATHPGTDPDGNNSVATIEVTVVDDVRPDLAVVAPDVRLQSIDDDNPGSAPIPPGRGSAVLAFVYNLGTRTAKGLRVDVSVPEHVMLTGPGPTGTCRISADKHRARCEYPAVEVLPGSFGQGPATLRWPITVAGDAPGPGTLTGGTVTVAAIAEADAPPLPLATAAPREIDLDATNNTDAFGVVVAGRPGGGAGGAGGGADGGGEDPVLPITGTGHGIAVAGAGLVVLGGVLLLLTRRRRIVTTG